jgi:4-amino-4-deoxy-L-arabinose transferase-like glycosyltransferase
VAALYPNLWANDALLLSEPLYGVMIALVLLAAYRLWDDPRPREAVLLGGAIGLATLTRAEALLLFVILAIPLIWLCRRVDRVGRGVLIAVVLATGAFVMAPWVGHNLSRFNQPVTLSYGLAGVLTQANCDRTYEGEYLGYWHPDCSFLDETIGPSAQECLRTPARCAEIYAEQFGDESDAAKLGQERGVEYISEHRGRLPVVMSARVGRMWGLFRPGQQVQIDAVGEGRPLWVARAALITFYELVAVSAVGLWLLRKRKVPILPLVSMAVLVTTVAALAIPVTRYRVPVEVAMAVLAGVVADQCVTWWRARRRAPGGRAGTAPPGDDLPSATDTPEPARG